MNISVNAFHIFYFEFEDMKRNLSMNVIQRGIISNLSPYNFGNSLFISIQFRALLYIFAFLLNCALRIFNKRAKWVHKIWLNNRFIN